jgi:hypothetical protein
VPSACPNRPARHARRPHGRGRRQDQSPEAYKFFFICGQASMAAHGPDTSFFNRFGRKSAPTVFFPSQAAQKPLHRPGRATKSRPADRTPTPPKVPAPPANQFA